MQIYKKGQKPPKATHSHHNTSQIHQQVINPNIEIEQLNQQQIMQLQRLYGNDALQRALVSGAPIKVPLHIQRDDTPEEETPAKTPQPTEVAGELNPDQPYKIVRVSWTLDDGPTGSSGNMKDALGAAGGTWFIVRSELGTGDELTANYKNMRDLIATEKHEFGIHSVHPTVNHSSWFPVSMRGTPQAYDTVDQVLADLQSFHTALKDNGVPTKFVRFTGGISSEVLAYLGKLGVPEKDRISYAKAIIREQPIADGAPAGVATAKTYYDTLMDGIKNLGLHLWDGSASGVETSWVSWGAESSGSGLTDNTDAMFKRKVNLVNRKQQPEALIILAHDTNSNNAEEASKDKANMEATATSEGIRIEYYKLSDLYTMVRDNKP